MSGPTPISHGHRSPLCAMVHNVVRWSVHNPQCHNYEVAGAQQSCTHEVMHNIALKNLHALDWLSGKGSVNRARRRIGHCLCVCVCMCVCVLSDIYIIIVPMESHAAHVVVQFSGSSSTAHSSLCQTLLTVRSVHSIIVLPRPLT